MNHRTLGGSLDVSALGIGCMPKLMAQFIDGADAKKLDTKCLAKLPYTPPFTGFYGWEP